MKKLQKGFTLVELLVITAIIGILAVIIFISLSNASGKANVAAFKSEVSGAASAAMLHCDESVNPNPLPAALVINTATDNVSWSKLNDPWSCGSNGSGTFTLKADPIKDMSASPACATGPVTMDKTGAHFPNGC